MHRNRGEACMAAGLIVGAILGCSGGPPPDNRPPLDVTAEQIVDIYKANEVAADQTFKGRQVVVVGTVDRISKDILDKPFVTLKGGKGEFNVRDVQAMFPAGTEGQLAQLRQGQAVRLRCRVNGLLMNVLMEGCAVESAPAAQAPAGDPTREVLLAAVVSAGESCDRVSRTFKQGTDGSGRVTWNVACRNGRAFAVSQAPGDTQSKVLSCAVLESLTKVRCFKTFDEQR